MEWKHKTSLEWMQERTKYLNASEIKSLVPYTSTGRKRKVTDDDYRRIAMSKNRDVMLEETYSTGAAARGHILEPYAIHAFNSNIVDISMNLGGSAVRPMWHWDDVLIYNPRLKASFSPDGGNICAPKGEVSLNYSDMEELTDLIEIKSYNIERHLSAIATPKNQLEERWQIAAAMAIDEFIDMAYLVFFNPSLYQSLIVHCYDRDDLASELSSISEVLDNWIRINKELEEEDERLGKSCVYVPDNKAVVISMPPFEKAVRKQVEQDLLNDAMSL